MTATQTEKMRRIMREPERRKRNALLPSDRAVGFVVGAMLVALVAWHAHDAIVAKVCPECASMVTR